VKDSFPKYLSYLLRHHPEDLDLNMDKAGWVSVNELIQKYNQRKKNKIDFDIVSQVVKDDNKQRFALEERNHNLYIRANQGHSIKDLDMGYIPVTPPDILYHGTGAKYIDSIMKTGLIPKSRQYVHLSPTIETAKTVGERHGTVRVLEVNSKQMHEDGILFYCSENGVWLTDFVDTKYLKTIF